LTEIEGNMKNEIDNKRNLERKLIVLNEQVRNKKSIDHLEKL
jgi:hypothetical protein